MRIWLCKFLYDIHSWHWAEAAPVRKVERKQIFRVFRIEGQTNLAAPGTWLLREGKGQRRSNMSILEDGLRMPVVYMWNRRSEVGQWHTSRNLEMLLLICEVLVCKFTILTC